jgi:nitrogen-specific signal transduction histidine kinase
MEETRRLPVAARLLILSVAVGGGASLLARYRDVADWHPADLITWGALVVGIALTERFPIPLRHRTESLHFSVTEALWVGALILARPSVLTLAVAVGVVFSQVFRRRPAYKLIFNVGQFVLALTAAQVIYATLNPAGGLTSRSLVVAGLAMATYSVLNACLVALVIAVVEHQPFQTIVLPPLRVNALHFAANTAIGLEGAVVWAVSPAALSLLLIPLMLAHVAYRKLVRDLREGERARDLIIENASDGIFLIAPEGRILSWNPAMERITGFSENEATDRSWSDLLALEDVAGYGSVEWNRLEPGPSTNGHRPGPSANGHHAGPSTDGQDVAASTNGHHPSQSTSRHGTGSSAGGHGIRTGVLASLVRKDGTPGWIQYSCNPVETGDGRVDVTVVVVHDVTAQRQTEQLKSDFVATISHELRTPLTPLKGFLSTLLQGTVEDTHEARQEYYAIMLKQTNRLERLITDLLEVSRVESDRPLMDRQSVEVAKPIREQIQAHADQQPDRVVRLEAPDRPVMVKADPSVLGLVMSNLISNAMKYSSPDTPVNVTVAVGTEHAIVSVRDQGIGIPRSEQDKVFDRFYQSESAHVRTGGGVGLGLYIARRLVEAMSGRLWVDSEPGCGSTFSFRLPLASGQEADQQSLLPPSLMPAAAN